MIEIQSFKQGCVWKSSFGLEKGKILKKSFRWRSSHYQPLDLTETFWVVETNVSKLRFLECLKLRHLLIGLSDKELQLLVDAPGFFIDHPYLSCLESIQSISSKEDEWQHRISRLQRLQRLRSMLGLPYWNLNLLYTYLGNLAYEVALIEQPIRKVKKFSGYVRTPSAVGTKSRSVQTLDLPAEIFDSSLFEDVDFDQYFNSEELDFDTLGFSGSSLYTILRDHFEREQELPDNMKHLLLKRPI